MLAIKGDDSHTLSKNRKVRVDSHSDLKVKTSLYETKANLLGNMWSVAPKSAIVKQPLEPGRIKALDMHSIMELRDFESTMQHDVHYVEPEGRWIKQLIGSLNGESG
jgi:hypothetical protein